MFEVFKSAVGRWKRRESRRKSPPMWTERLLRWSLPAGTLRESVVGDLREELLLGGLRSRMAYRREALSISFRYWGARLRKSLARGARGGRPQRGRGGSMNRLLLDLRHALRALGKRPGFSLVAIALLALGLGATTAIFSVVDKALLRPLPVQQPDQLIKVYTTCRRGFLRCSSSYPDFLDYRDRTRSIADMSGYSWLPASVGEEGRQAALATVMAATGNYFELLGLRPAYGRLLQPRDHEEALTVAVLSYDFWRGRYGGDESVIGRDIRLNGTPFSVVGVAPPGFRGIDLGSDTDIFLPMRSAARLGVGAISQPDIWETRGARWISGLVGRLAPGSSLPEARQELLALSEALRQEDPEARGPRSVTVDDSSGYALPSSAREDLSSFVLLLLAVVAMTLLLACASLANLLLARASSRRRETGLRLCLGAGRGRIIRQLLTESLLLSLAGALAGLLVAVALLRALGGYQLPGNIPISDLAIELDWQLFAFAAALALLTGLLFGLIPALQSVRLNPVDAIRGDGRCLEAGASPLLRKALLSLQVGMCLVLMIGAGIFLGTVYRGLGVELGFPSRGLALSRFNLTLLDYQPQQAMDFVGRLQAGVEGLPQVESAAVATRVPLQVGGARGTFVEVPGYTPAPDEELRVEYLFVTPGYFQTLGLPLLEGRSFSNADREGAPQVVIINQSMAKRYWEASPLGRNLILPGGESAEVVGVARSTTWRGLEDQPVNFVYLPLLQSPSFSTSFLTLMARARDGDAQALLPLLRQQFRGLDPQLALSSEQTMQEQMRAVLMPQRMGAFLLSALGSISVLLALVGVYGIVSFIVSQRRRDIGVHLALGASRGRILRMMMSTVLPPVGLGLAAGLAAALALGGSLESFVFRMSPYDPATLAACLAGLALVAALSAWWPARRATRLDPMRVLSAD
ncbi:MAG TPA: ADOP family duplicated permease [Acidobacteriota bacterium]|nr:ADOP family duplicated permease [Acidobacteriota bacterium]